MPLLPVYLTKSIIKTLFSYIMPSAPLSPQCPPQELEMAGPLSAARPQSPSNWDAASFTEILTPTPLYFSPPRAKVKVQNGPNRADYGPNRAKNSVLVPEILVLFAEFGGTHTPFTEKIYKEVC